MAATSVAHPVDEVLKPGPMVVYGLQHVMSMYAGVVAVPLIVGSAMGLPFGELAYLLSAGVQPAPAPLPTRRHRRRDHRDRHIAAAGVVRLRLFNGMRRDVEAPIAAEGPTPGVTPDQDVPGGRRDDT